ncbi:hypothetical protein OEZ85_010972 [Tetradesmus obliquus]|uniref:Uncharacterized protein n=1 Tax=Tetradesmus obliquus TaxID=3088 RepID=A0ABY8TPK4_TETOB|nr:hypothetical protein OEZ85_010972 [Tetradesmus obliquus]
MFQQYTVSIPDGVLMEEVEVLFGQLLYGMVCKYTFDSEMLLSPQKWKGLLRLCLLGHHLKFKPLLDMATRLVVHTSHGPRDGDAADADVQFFCPSSPVETCPILSSSSLMAKVVALGDAELSAGILRVVVKVIHYKQHQVESLGRFIEAFGGAAGCPLPILQACLFQWCRQVTAAEPAGVGMDELQCLLPPNLTMDHVWPLMDALLSERPALAPLEGILQPAITAEAIAAGTEASKQFVMAAVGSSKLLGMLLAAVPAWTAENGLLRAVADAVSEESPCPELLTALSGAVDISTAVNAGWTDVVRIFLAALKAAAAAAAASGSDLHVSGKFVHAVWAHMPLDKSIVDMVAAASNEEFEEFEAAEWEEGCLGI